MYHTVETELRFVLVHYHLFKNAGTTLEYILQNNFSGHFAYLHGEMHNSTVTGDDLLRFLSDHPEVKAISNHHLCCPGPESQNFVFFDMIFLRHTLDRLLSVYEFCRRAEATWEPLEIQAKNFERGPFLDLLLRGYPHLVNDVQVNWLANGGRYTRPPDESDLGRATSLIKKGACIISDCETKLHEFVTRCARHNNGELGLELRMPNRKAWSGLPCSRPQHKRKLLRAPEKNVDCRE